MGETLSPFFARSSPKKKVLLNLKISNPTQKFSFINLRFSNKLVFYNVEARQRSTFCNRARLNFKVVWHQIIYSLTHSLIPNVSTPN